MSKIVYYRQCRLTKTDARGDVCRVQVSWIPEKFAVLEKRLRIKNDGGKWDDGWVVVYVSTVRLAEDRLPDPHLSIKAHRKNTGDSLPKEKR